MCIEGLLLITLQGPPLTKQPCMDLLLDQTNPGRPAWNLQINAHTSYLDLEVPDQV